MAGPTWLAYPRRGEWCTAWRRLGHLHALHREIWVPQEASGIKYRRQGITMVSSYCLQLGRSHMVQDWEVCQVSASHVWHWPGATHLLQSVKAAKALEKYMDQDMKSCLTFCKDSRRLSECSSPGISHSGATFAPLTDANLLADISSSLHLHCIH